MIAAKLPSTIGTNSAKYVLAKHFWWDGDRKDEGDKPICICGMCGNYTSGNGTINAYDWRKFRYVLPGNSTCPPFEPLANLPTDIFWYSVGECLGPQGLAAKHLKYKNPEFFSYHHMSFFDVDYCLEPYRLTPPDFKRKTP